MSIVRYIAFIINILLVSTLFPQGNQLIHIDESDPYDPTQLRDWVINTLHGGGGEFDTASISFTGNPQQLGKFSFGEPSIGLDTGLVISTGQVMQIQSYNNRHDDTWNFYGEPDPDLDKLVEDFLGTPLFPPPPGGLKYTGDAAVIEFNYIPYGEEIVLKYVFGSEEYQYWMFPSPPPDDVNLTDGPYQLDPARMFDFFGISIMRPNLPFKNLALLPELAGGDPVSINSVNDHNNDVFYEGNPVGGGSYGVQFDGFTKTMDALIIRQQVIPCIPYKVKIGVEDFLGQLDPDDPDSRGYHWNSGVFIGGGSLIGGESAPPWTVEYEWTHSNSQFDGKLIEGGCNELLVTFTLDYASVSANPYYIPFRIESDIYRDNIELTYDDTGEVISIDSITFNYGETEKTIRLSAVNLTADVPNVKFAYPETPCDRPHPPIGGGSFNKQIPFQLINNEPFTFDANPKVYTAYCKETINLTVTDITNGGVDPVIYIWPTNPTPPVDSYDYTISASPDWVNVGVKDLCGKDTSVNIRIDNKPIVLDPIQQIFLCGPGQSATVPVVTVFPNPNDQPDYSIEHVKWWKQGNPNPPLGDQDGDEITVVYDNVVGDAIWTCEYNMVDICGGEASDSFEVNQSSLVLNNDGICSGEDIVLFTGTPAHWFEWYREEPNGDLTLVGTTQSTTDSNYPAGVSEIRYKLKIEDNCGELQEAWMTVYIDIYEPQISLDPGDEICHGMPITLTANDGATEYLWSNNESTQSIQLDATEYQLGVNDYTLYTVSSSDYYYCENSADVSFTVYANPEASFAIDPADHPCTNTDIKFDYINDETSRAFLWDFGDGSPNDTKAHTIHQYSNAGTYNVNLFVEHTYPSGYKCSSDSTASVIVDPLPVADFTPNPVEGCEPLEVTFTDNSQDVFPNANYEWDFGDGNSMTGYPGSVNHTYDSAGSYSIGLTVRNTDRCFASTSYQYVKVNPNPDADFVADPWVTTMDNPEIIFTNESGSDDPLDLFEWDFDDNSTSNQENPSHTYIEPGLYNVYFRVQTENGCWDTIVKQVELSLYVKMYIPSAFSPNGDGLNDKFEIMGTPITDFNMYIYDRWGKQIWSTHNWEIQWDGTDSKGNIVPVGTYIYKIAGTSPDPDANYELGAITYQGTVTVTR